MGGVRPERADVKPDRDEDTKLQMNEGNEANNLRERPVFNSQRRVDIEV